jgi:autoinducer 2 (AI-2) kinase
VTDASFLTLDAGTSGGRAAIFDVMGRQLAVAAAAWDYETPPDAAPWGRAFDAGRFWGILTGLTRQALVQANIPAEAVAAVSVTSQRGGLVILDAAGAPLYAGPIQDLRGVFQAAALEETWGERLYAISGHRPALIFAPARLRWFAERQPELFRSFHALLTISDWLVFCLSGVRGTEPSAAADTQLFDIEQEAWSAELLAGLSLPRALFPPVQVSGAIVGEVTATAAAQTGLRPGTPVVMGGADTQMGLLGMGMTALGQVGILAGWSMPVQQVIAAPRSGQGRLWVGNHVLPGRWVLEGNAGPAGRALAWLADVMFGRHDFAALERLAASVAPGAGGALAFLGPQPMNAAEMGLAWGGLLMPLGADFIGVERPHLARAVLENIAFAARANLDLIVEVSQTPAAQVAVGGGLTRSRVWTHMLADVLAQPVRISALPDASSRGAAVSAAVGAGFYPDLVTAAAAMSRDDASIDPARVAVAEYLDLYERWQQAREQLDMLGRVIG